MTSKMFLDIVGVITTSKLSILSTFQGGLPEPTPMSSRVNIQGTQILRKKQRINRRPSFKQIHFERWGPAFNLSLRLEIKEESLQINQLDKVNMKE